MTVGKANKSYVCARCLIRLHGFRISDNARLFSRSGGLLQNPNPTAKLGENEEEQGTDVLDGDIPGRMSERLAQMTEEGIEQGGRSAQRAIDEAGFSAELKKKLEARLQEGGIKGKYPAAFSQLDMPSSAGEGTRKIASAQPWAGDEKIEDAALRMLNDAHKPLRGTRTARIPQPKGLSANVDLRLKRAVQRSNSERLANARDRTSRYALSQDQSLSEKEREQMRKTLKERFTSGARPMPATVQGLASLANERIEDAIARGQFKNIPRGKGTNVERDHNANSPFLDTTEYFMNKMIQKQDIVPPWIEKQQELVKAAAVFRGRLRKEWKRHAARVIASSGGSLEDQVHRAERYAEAERSANPPMPKREAISEIDSEGRLSQLTITETRSSSSSSTEDVKITVSEDLATETESLSTPVESDLNGQETVSPSPLSQSEGVPTDTTIPLRSLNPFRDSAWLSLEEAYHSLAIRELNNLTRSYNLQAPDLAKKPYYSLERELRSCYADVAPQLPNEIRERARRPEKIRVEIIGHRPGGVLEKFSTDKVNVYDSKKPHYGFREFWKDLWSGDMVRA